MRSANWLLKNIPTKEAIAKALRIQDCSLAVKPRAGKYAKITGSHAPQNKEFEEHHHREFGAQHVGFVGVAERVSGKDEERILAGLGVTGKKLRE